MFGAWFCRPVSTLSQKFLLPVQVTILLGGVAVGGGKHLQAQIVAAQKEQLRLCTQTQEKGRKGARKPKVAVDKVFGKRLQRILAM